jgi:hypothetical protein
MHYAPGSSSRNCDFTVVRQRRLPLVKVTLAKRKASDQNLENYAMRLNLRGRHRSRGSARSQFRHQFGFARGHFR